MAGDSAGRGEGGRDGLLHRNPVAAWLRVETRYLRLPQRALIPRHADTPALAQLQANREGALFGPGLIIFREGLRISSGS